MRYYADSIFGWTPVQVPIENDRLQRWVNRIGAYWRRGKARHVARAIVSDYKPGKRLIPSQEQLAHLAALIGGSCCVKTVWRWIKRFANAGFLSKYHRRDGDDQISNAYLLRVELEDLHDNVTQPAGYPPATCNKSKVSTPLSIKSDSKGWVKERGAWTVSVTMQNRNDVGTETGDDLAEQARARRLKAHPPRSRKWVVILKGGRRREVP